MLYNIIIITFGEKCKINSVVGFNKVVSGVNSKTYEYID